MKSSKITTILAILFLGMFLFSCGGPKTCSTKGKTRVPMGHM